MSSLEFTKLKNLKDFISEKVYADREVLLNLGNKVEQSATHATPQLFLEDEPIGISNIMEAAARIEIFTGVYNQIEKLFSEHKSPDEIVNIMKVEVSYRCGFIEECFDMINRTSFEKYSLESRIKAFREVKKFLM